MRNQNNLYSKWLKAIRQILNEVGIPFLCESNLDTSTTVPTLPRYLVQATLTDQYWLKMALFTYVVK